MSFLIAVYVNEGIVLASDRRTTYNNTQVENGILIQKIGIHTNILQIKPLYVLMVLVSLLVVMHH